MLAFSFDSLLVRLQGLPAPAVLFWRGAAGAIGFLIVSLFVYRRHIIDIFRTSGWSLPLIGLCAAVGNTMFIVSLSRTSVAHTLVLFASTPILTAVIARVVFGERLRRRTWVTSLVILLGVLGIFFSGLGSVQIGGDLAALLGALSYSLLLILLRRFPNGNHLMAMWFGSVLCVAVAAPFVHDFSLTGRQAAIAFVNGSIVVPVGLVLVIVSLRYLAASEASLMTLLEPVLGPIWVWWILGEAPSLQTLGSGLVILAGVLGYLVMELRVERAPTRQRW